jgi:hypothetical protein
MKEKPRQIREKISDALLNLQYERELMQIKADENIKIRMTLFGGKTDEKER